MKKVILIIILFSSSISVSQTDEKIRYEAKSMEMSLKQEDGSVNTKPIGRNINITYDTFFKSYYITFDAKSGYSYFDLSYIQDMNDKNGTIKMIDKSKTIMYVVDKLSEGSLLIMLEKKFETEYGSARGYIIISGATLK